MKAGLHQLVDALPDEAVEGAGLFLERVLRGEVDREQVWVWTTEWQGQLRSSLAELAEGRTRRFDSTDEFLASLWHELAGRTSSIALRGGPESRHLPTISSARP